MSKQAVLSCQRKGNTLTLKLKCDFQSNPSVAVAAVVILCSFCSFQAGSRHGGNSYVDFFFWYLTLFLMIGGGLYLLSLWACIRTLRYNADSLEVDDDYQYTPLKRRRKFDRDGDSIPVSRTVVAPGKLDENTFRWKKNYTYETWIPFGAAGWHGTVCRHESEGKMLELENEFCKFWADVPCREKTVDEAARSESLKDYSVDRGEDFPMKDDVLPEKLFTVTCELEENDDKRILTLVSEKGSQLSRLIAKCSFWLNGTVSFLLLLGLLASVGLAWYYWPILDSKMIAFLQSNQLHNEILPQIVPHDMVDTVTKLAHQLSEAQPTDRMLCGLGFFLTSLFPLLLIVSLVFGVFFRWPFWKRWSLRLEHSKKRHHTLTYDWETDRHKERCPRTCFVPFFKAIPATSQTNRIITGRPIFSLNSAWGQLFQVVILTADRSISFPVADQEEQERIIRVLYEFVDQVTAH